MKTCGTCDLQDGKPQHVVRIAGNTGSEEWLFWVDLEQVRLLKLSDFDFATCKSLTCFMVWDVVQCQNTHLVTVVPCSCCQFLLLPLPKGNL